ncbi:DUF6504 family protein [Nocardioides psychrotolerans]|uniref:DUF6504 family protein n=1 Tax=Nocardioides psychrotolerans TaxID=1005945 RepID=UPI0031379FC2
MRRYDDPVEVRQGGDGPEQFLWRGRLWKVRSVLAHWVETGPWWQGAPARAVIGSDEPPGEPGVDDLPTGVVPIGDLMAERELWRVEAGRGLVDLDGHDGGSSGSPADRSGVFDLSLDWSDGRWQLVGCVD